jgi:hypothetical protein
MEAPKTTATVMEQRNEPYPLGNEIHSYNDVSTIVPQAENMIKNMADLIKSRDALIMSRDELIKCKDKEYTDLLNRYMKVTCYSQSQSLQVSYYKWLCFWISSFLVMLVLFYFYHFYYHSSFSFDKDLEPPFHQHDQS